MAALIAATLFGEPVVAPKEVMLNTVVGIFDGAMALSNNRCSQRSIIAEAGGFSRFVRP